MNDAEHIAELLTALFAGHEYCVADEEGSQSGTCEGPVDAMVLGDSAARYVGACRRHAEMIDPQYVIWRRSELQKRDDRIFELCKIIERAGQPFIDEANRVVPKETT